MSTTAPTSPARLDEETRFCIEQLDFVVGEFLDILLEGRSDDLDEKEQAAFDRAEKAMQMAEWILAR
jgi:hypothetical protein